MPPPPKPRSAAMAGGRRVGKGRRTGPSEAKAKLYREYDKEKQKRSAKQDKGGRRNDQSGATLRKLGVGLAAVLAVAAVLFVLVAYAEKSPRQVASNTIAPG